MLSQKIKAIDILIKSVQLGSIRQAAIAKGISPQAASQALIQLEEMLGVRLLNRTTRRLSVTEEGQNLINTTQPALLSLNRAFLNIKNNKNDITGSLRIIGPSSGFAPVLWPIINEFCQTYPEIQPNVQLDDNIKNWVINRVDVGFHFGVTLSEELIARQLVPVQLIICASPDYLKEYGVPRSLDELSLHKCSIFQHPGSGYIFPWYVNINGKIETIEVPPSFITNNIDIEIQAALDGKVISQLSSLSVTHLIRERKLVPLFIKNITDHMHIHIYYGTKHKQPLKVRKFIDLAVNRLKNNKNLTLSKQELNHYTISL